MNWLKQLNNSLDYFEKHMTEAITLEDIADQAYYSYHHYARMFYMLSNITLSEYVRNRRLTMAASDLVTTDQKVIDIAFKYQYNTPEAFTKAFKRYHGVTPSEVRKRDVQLKNCSKLSFQLQIKGDEIMEYEIKTTSNLLFSGITRTFTTENNQNFVDIPKFWEDVMTDGTYAKMVEETELPTVGLCYDMDFKDNTFKYMIGVWGKEVPLEDAETVTFEDTVFAVFKSKGALPKSLQHTINQVYSEWLPSSNYEHAGNPEIEVYPNGDGSKDDYECEYWIPVKEKSTDN